MEVLAIAEMTPGPIAVNTATFVGYRLARIPGAVLGTAGVVLPSLIIITIIAAYFVQYNISEIPPAQGRLYGPAAGSYWPNCLGRFQPGEKGYHRPEVCFDRRGCFCCTDHYRYPPYFCSPGNGNTGGGVFSLACLSMGVRMRCWRSWLPWKNAMKN